MAKDSTTIEAPAIGPATQAVLYGPEKAAPAPYQVKRNAAGMPVWDDPVQNPRKVHRDAVHAYRDGLLEAAFEELEAGPKQFRVALVGKDGHPLKVLNRRKPVDHLIVGAHSPDEARGKFCRINGIHGGQEFVKVLDTVGA